eukprot:m51a1_g14432 hypothetical protein (134) ;mRNA; f:528964-529675
MPVDVLYMLRVAELMAVTDCKGAPRQPPANPPTIHGNSAVSPCKLRTTSELGLCATLPVLALKATEGIAVLLALRHPEERPVTEFVSFRRKLVTLAMSVGAMVLAPDKQHVWTVDDTGEVLVWCSRAPILVFR